MRTRTVRTRTMRNLNITSSRASRTGGSGCQLPTRHWHSKGHERLRLTRNTTWRGSTAGTQITARVDRGSIICKQDVAATGRVGLTGTVATAFTTEQKDTTWDTASTRGTETSRTSRYDDLFLRQINQSLFQGAVFPYCEYTTQRVI